MIEIRNVTKSFNNEVVLKNINLEINPNEILGIVGLSGAGKSTLIRMMNGLVKPTDGEVYVNGRSINNLRQKDLNRMRYSIGMVFQQYNLLSSMTVYDNIKLALKIAKYDKNNIEKRIYEVLELVGLTEKVKSYPNELSGGQKQRVAIARALANHPEILLCDEATSSLDQKTATDIVKLLKEIKRKTKILIVFITHQIEVAKDLCERIIVMEDGSIIEDQITKNLFVYPQNEITKELIKSVVYDVEIKAPGVYELIYTDKNSNDAIISNTVKKYDIDINILHGKNLAIGDEYIGYLYVQLFGKQVEQAIEYLKLKGIEVKPYV